MSREAFIATVAPIAVKVRVDGGVLFPSVSIAQMILETGGKINSWFNLVGYKVGSGRRTPYWQGRSVSAKTWEVYDGDRVEHVSADFRAYDSIEHCLKDQALLFIHNPGRYQRVIDARSPGEQAKMLQECGYATDPQYAAKLNAIITLYKLETYDEEANTAMEKIAELERKLDDMDRRITTYEQAIARLAMQVQELTKQHQVDVPDWAKPAIEAAANTYGIDGRKIIDTPDGGSIDFYRLVTVMYRAGLFGKDQP
jgi:flagellar protein FlgJ